ncbi:MAG: hypothetical protein EA378_00100, partial [Phycisphaerales bacterium]
MPMPSPEMTGHVMPGHMRPMFRTSERAPMLTGAASPDTPRSLQTLFWCTLMILCCVLGGQAATADECEPTWASLTGQEIGVSGGIRAMAVFDDGSGPALYAGGVFTTAGGVEVNRVARWNGSTWSALEGPSGIGVNGTVRALAVYDDGSGPALYAGGYFSTAG